MGNRDGCEMMALKKYQTFCIVFLSLIPLALAAVDEDAFEKRASTVQKLQEKILRDYDRDVRPVEHHSNTTQVWMTFMPLAVVCMEEDISLFHLDSWLYMRWHDKRLAWNVSEYDGVRRIHLPDHFIWQPDIVLYNGHSGMIDPKGDSHLVLRSSGLVTYIPPATMVTLCPMEQQGLYPKDMITCVIEIGSWTHHGWEIDLQLASASFMAMFSNTNPRWELLIEEVNLTREVKYYNCCVEPYMWITAQFPMKRRTPPELKVVWSPCILVMAMTLAMFWIPSNSSKKIYLGAFLFLMLCLYMIFVAISTKSYRSIKRAVTFVESTLYAVAAAIISEIFVICLSSIIGPIRPPEVLVKVLSGSFGKYILVRPSWETNGSGDKLQLKEEGDDEVRLPTINEEWLLVASGLDRLHFVLFIAIFATIHQI